MTPAELRRTTDGLASELVVVPTDGPDVCPTCRSWRPPESALCTSCEQLEALSSPCPVVVPISLYAKPSPMRDRLRFYKDPEGADHARYPGEVAAIVERFFSEHGDRLRARTGGWDTVCVVPSTSRPPPHPLAMVLEGCSTLDAPQGLLVRGAGEVGHRRPSDAAFVPRGAVNGRRILVLDDVYTSGARAHSAASALTVAGATVAVIVVIARRVNPGWEAGVQALWDRQVALHYDFAAPPWWASG